MIMNQNAWKITEVMQTQEGVSPIPNSGGLSELWRDSTAQGKRMSVGWDYLFPVYAIVPRSLF